MEDREGLSPSGPGLSQYEEHDARERGGTHVDTEELWRLLREQYQALKAACLWYSETVRQFFPQNAEEWDSIKYTASLKVNPIIEALQRLMPPDYSAILRHPDRQVILYFAEAIRGIYVTFWQGGISTQMIWRHVHSLEILIRDIKTSLVKQDDDKTKASPYPEHDARERGGQYLDPVELLRLLRKHKECFEMVYILAKQSDERSDDATQVVERAIKSLLEALQDCMRDDYSLILHHPNRKDILDVARTIQELMKLCLQKKICVQLTEPCFEQLDRLIHDIETSLEGPNPGGTPVSTTAVKQDYGKIKAIPYPEHDARHIDPDEFLRLLRKHKECFEMVYILAKQSDERSDDATQVSLELNQEAKLTIRTFQGLMQGDYSAILGAPNRKDILDVARTIQELMKLCLQKKIFVQPTEPCFEQLDRLIHDIETSLEGPSTQANPVSGNVNTTAVKQDYVRKEANPHKGHHPQGLFRVIRRINPGALLRSLQEQEEFLGIAYSLYDHRTKQFHFLPEQWFSEKYFVSLRAKSIMPILHGLKRYDYSLILRHPKIEDILDVARKIQNYMKFFLKQKIWVEMIEQYFKSLGTLITNIETARKSRPHGLLLIGNVDTTEAREDPDEIQTTLDRGHYNKVLNLLMDLNLLSERLTYIETSLEEPSPQGVPVVYTTTAAKQDDDKTEASLDKEGDARDRGGRHIDPEELLRLFKEQCEALKALYSWYKDDSERFQAELKEWPAQYLAGSAASSILELIRGLTPDDYSVILRHPNRKDILYVAGLMKGYMQLLRSEISTPKIEPFIKSLPTLRTSIESLLENLNHPSSNPKVTPVNVNVKPEVALPKPEEQYSFDLSILIETLKDFERILRKDLNSFQYKAMCTVAFWIMNTYGRCYNKEVESRIRYEIYSLALAGQHLLAVSFKKYCDDENYSLGVGPLTYIVGNAIWAFNSFSELSCTVPKPFYKKRMIKSDDRGYTIHTTTSNVFVNGPLGGDKTNYIENLTKLLVTTGTDDVEELWGLLCSSLCDFGKHFGPDYMHLNQDAVTCVSAVCKVYDKLQHLDPALSK